MEVGMKAPEILGTDSDGNEIRLSDYAGKKLILYFYPKDSTPGCTAEACSFRDNYTSLLDSGYSVIGVSADSMNSHTRFKTKNNLPFPLISDPDKRLAQQFGVWGEKKLAGRTYMGIYRTTFIIDESGIIEQIIGPKEIKVKEHAKQILKPTN